MKIKLLCVGRLVDLPASDDISVRILRVAGGPPSTSICLQYIVSSQHQISQCAVIEEVHFWMDLVCVGGVPVDSEVSDRVQSRQFGVRLNLGVVQASHKQSATWLTADDAS